MIIFMPVKSTITSSWVLELVAITRLRSLSFSWIMGEEWRSRTRGSLRTAKFQILTEPSEPAEYILPDLSYCRQFTGPLWLIN